MTLIVHERYAAYSSCFKQPVASPIALETPYTFHREYEIYTIMQLIAIITVWEQNGVFFIVIVHAKIRHKIHTNG